MVSGNPFNNNPSFQINQPRTTAPSEESDGIPPLSTLDNEAPRTQSSRPRKIIKIDNHDRNLLFKGKDVEKFIRRFEKSATVDGASAYDMVSQILFFMEKEEFMDEIEDMTGFIDEDWESLKVQMKKKWGIIAHSFGEIE